MTSIYNVNIAINVMAQYTVTAKTCTYVHSYVRYVCKYKYSIRISNYEATYVQ